MLATRLTYAPHARHHFATGAVAAIVLFATPGGTPSWAHVSAQHATTRAATTQSNPPADDPLATRLDALREEHDVPALGAALFRNGTLEQIAVVGVTAANGEEPVAPDDAWHIGSCTKAMTATLAARLVEQGKIDWDTTLAEGLPELAPAMHEPHKSVTLRQLLGHRGGIVGHEANSYAMPMIWAVEKEMADQPMRERRREVAARILKAAPAGEPGSEFRYSNYGYVLAGAMLEEAGDAAWEDLMRKEVFEPLGMTTAGFGPPPRIRGHVKSTDGWTPQERDNPAIVGPAGTVHLSLRDWSRFAAAHLGQVEGFLKPETLAILHEPLRGEGASYALGWGVRKNADGGTQLSHAGSNTMWYAVILLEPDAGRVRLAAANAVGENVVHKAIGALTATSPSSD